MDMIGRQIELVTGTISTLLPSIKNGSAKRSTALPGVPTMLEAGLPGFNVVNYFVLMALAGTPPAVVSRLNVAINQVLSLSDVLTCFKTEAAEAAPDSPAQLGQFIESDYRA